MERCTQEDQDSKLLWEAYGSNKPFDNPHHQKEVAKLKRENPQLPLMRAKAKIDMKANGSDIKLTDADKQALIDHGQEELIPHEEDFEYGGHTGEQRITSVEKQAYVVADSQGVYGVYTTMQGAAGARDEIGGGSYVVGVSVDVDPQQYDEISDMDLKKLFQGHEL